LAEGETRNKSTSLCPKVTAIISLGGRPFHPSVLSSIHPSSSSRKKKMMGDFRVSEGHGYPLVFLYKCMPPKLHGTKWYYKKI
jgi:hypothetical protein